MLDKNCSDCIILARGIFTKFHLPMLLAKVMQSFLQVSIKASIWSAHTMSMYIYVLHLIYCCYMITAQ
jgi:hypothetical protein